MIGGVRSRIARAMSSDIRRFTHSWRNVVPKAPHSRLSAKGFKYLPRLLSIRAVEKFLEPVPFLLPGIDVDELDDIVSKAQVLKREGLDVDANLIWNAVAQEARNVMVTMWLTRESNARSAIAHPIPTAVQALEIIDSVLNLSAQAKGVARTVVRFGVDKKGARVTMYHLCNTSPCIYTKYVV